MWFFLGLVLFFSVVVLNSPRNCSTMWSYCHSVIEGAVVIGLLSFFESYFVVDGMAD